MNMWKKLYVNSSQLDRFRLVNYTLVKLALKRSSNCKKVILKTVNKMSMYNLPQST